VRDVAAEVARYLAEPGTYSGSAGSDGRQSTGTRPRGTHCDRVLDLLADGRWHSHLELYQLGTVAHSRVADLRRRGHRIDCRRDCDLYLYRLVTVRGEGGAVPEPAGVPVAPRRPGLAARRGPDAAPSPGPAQQLEMTVA